MSKEAKQNLAMLGIWMCTEGLMLLLFIMPAVAVATHFGFGWEWTTSWFVAFFLAVTVVVTEIVSAIYRTKAEEDAYWKGEGS